MLELDSDPGFFTQGPCHLHKVPNSCGLSQELNELIEGKLSGPCLAHTKHPIHMGHS